MATSTAIAASGVPQLIFTIFSVSFPLIVLTVFLLLATKLSDILYGPDPFKGISAPTAST